MIGLFSGMLFRMVCARSLAGPCAMLALLMGVFAVCGCACRKCRLRDFFCLKRFFRFTGQDQFDDFELMILVHEVMFDCQQQGKKKERIVRVTAGNHSVATDSNTNDIFQQALHIDVEQGTDSVYVELVATSGTVLATLTLDTIKDLVSTDFHAPETMYTMHAAKRALGNPKIKLTMVMGKQEDTEAGLLLHTDMNSEVDVLVRQQLRKAKIDSSHTNGHGARVEDANPDLSEMELLQKACSGPLEMFVGLGQTRNVYVAVIGPPTTKRWALAVWPDSAHYQKQHSPMKVMDLLKVESIQGDPARHHVFVVNFFEQKNVRETISFRRTDRARDVWVEILLLLVTKSRDMRVAQKTSGRLAGSSADGLRKTCR